MVYDVTSCLLQTTFYSPLQSNLTELVEWRMFLVEKDALYPGGSPCMGCLWKGNNNKGVGKKIVLNENKK